MMTKQIFSCFGLYFLLLNNFSFSMQLEQEQGGAGGNPPGYEEAQHMFQMHNIHEQTHLDRTEAQTIVDQHPLMAFTLTQKSPEKKEKKF